VNKLDQILIIHNEPRMKRGKPLESDAGVLDEVAAVQAALARLGLPCQTIGLRSLGELGQTLGRFNGLLAVNLVEDFVDKSSDMSLVPAVCASRNVSVTGCDTGCMIVSGDKWMTKALLRQAGIRCPSGLFVRPEDDADLVVLPPGKYIVKPVSTDASEGIDSQSVVTVPGGSLRSAIRRIHKSFGQAALIEEFVGIRELNVSLFEVRDRPQVIAVAEIDFSLFPRNSQRIVDYKAKWLKDSFEYQNTPVVLPARISAAQRRLIETISLKTWRVLRCRDYARIDFRLDDVGAPVVLEANANPDISPDAGFGAALKHAGYSFDCFIKTLLENAARRAGRPAPAQTHTRSITRRSGLGFRPATITDREGVMLLLNQPRFFRPDELLVAEEVFDDAVNKGEASEYLSRVLLRGNQLLGWICFGPTPCTIGTFDVYWIAVAPGHQGKGYGKKMMKLADREMAALGGRLSVIETASREDYIPTQKFYLSAGYREESRVRDFYTTGDDRIIFSKRLAAR
jgi:D-alanine-D-alanine ligase